MREMDFLHHFQRVAAPERQRCRRPFADAIHGQDRRLLEWRGEKRRGGMALVMLGEQQPVVAVVIRREALELLSRAVASGTASP